MTQALGLRIVQRVFLLFFIFKLILLKATKVVIFQKRKLGATSFCLQASRPQPLSLLCMCGVSCNVSLGVF